MSLTGIAALIAAVSFAVLAGAGVYLSVRFTRVLDDAATLVRDTRSDQQALFARANTAVDRANAQLDLTEAATASVGELGTAMTELAGQASALAGVGRTVAGAVVGGPLGRAAAVAYGVRHAVGVRTGARQRRPLAGQVVAGPELPAAPSASAASPAPRQTRQPRQSRVAGPGRRDDPPRVLAGGRGGGRDHGLPAGLLDRPPAVGDAVAGRPPRRRRPGRERRAARRRRPRRRGSPRASRSAAGPGADWCAGPFGSPATRGCSAGTSGKAWTCIWFGIGPREALRLAQARLVAALTSAAARYRGPWRDHSQR